MDINRIQMVKVTEKGFLPDGSECTEVDEFYSDGYIRYKLKKGSQKKLDKKTITVPKQEMRAFFDRLYVFVRESDVEFLPMEDHDTRIEFIYSVHHKEVFDKAYPCREDDSLIHQIGMMIMAHEDI